MTGGEYLLEPVKAFLAVIFVAAVLAVVAFLGWSSWSDSRLNGHYEVETVLDGDTIYLTSDLVVDIAGIDAPDLDDCQGPEAAELLTELLPDGTTIRLSGAERATDRVVAHVWVTSPPDDERLVAEHLLVAGLAIRTPGPPVDLQRARLRRAENVGREAQLGVWACP